MTNSILKFATIVLVVVQVAGCATTSQTEAPTDERGRIDYDQLQSTLGMDRSIDDLGFAEKRFNDCQVGLSNSNCRNRYLTVIHFRIQCRDSQGTVQSVSNQELIPVRSNSVRWKVGLVNGRTTTDGDGYGQIAFVAPGSSQRQKLTLMINGQALGTTAAEITRLVVPKDWCS